MKHKIIVLCLFLWLNPVYAKALKIGYINVGHILSTSPQFSKMKEDLAKEFKPQKEKLLKSAKELDILVKKFKKDEATMSEDEAKARFEEIKPLEIKFKKSATALEKQLDEQREAELAKIEELINKIIKEVALNKKYDLIFYQEVAYASDKADVSDLISKQLRKLFK